MKASVKAVAAAALCAAVFSADAADVRMYGIIDTGIILESNKMGTQDTSTYAREEFGVNLGPRLGWIVTEDINPDLKVRVQLENLFQSDDGQMRFDRLWGGESSLALQGRYGELAFGRVGGLTSPFGRWGIFGLEATPFGNGWGRAGGVHYLAGVADRVDNSISYATPKFLGGLQFFGQYSFSTGSNAGAVPEEAKQRHNTRRGSIAFRYKTDSFTTVGVLDHTWNTHNKAGANYGEDTTIASLAVNFLTVPSVRLFLMGQYFENVYTAPGTPVHSVAKLVKTGLAADNLTGIAGRGFDGYNVGLNAQIKLWGGDLYLTSAYDDWEYKGHVVDGQETSLKHYLLGAAYEYPLAKTVHIYGAANWTHGSGLFDTDNFSDSLDPNSWQVMGGITYFF